MYTTAARQPGSQAAQQAYVDTGRPRDAYAYVTWEPFLQLPAFHREQQMQLKLHLKLHLLVKVQLTTLSTYRDCDY